MRPRPWVLLIFLSVGACQEAPGSRLLSAFLDLRPPLLAEARALTATSVLLGFDEPATATAQTVSIAELPVESVEASLNSLTVHTGPQIPGAAYELSATVEDERGNRASFTVGFYGHNPAPPRLLINEFTTQGTRSRPDMVELIALTGGNLGGVTFYDGTPGDWRSRLTLPPVEIGAGEFVVIHCVWDPAASDELNDPDSSSHPNALAGVWDFWLLEGTGLSGNNGVLTLYQSPARGLLDGVVYSNRTSGSDTRYRGFGTKAVLQRVERLAAAGGWEFNSESPRPEDAVDSSFTTSTRSLSRASSPADTDGNSDWHTVPTRGATFGTLNRDDRYQPD